MLESRLKCLRGNIDQFRESKVAVRNLIIRKKSIVLKPHILGTANRENYSEARYISKACGNFGKGGAGTSARVNEAPCFSNFNLAVSGSCGIFLWNGENKIVQARYTSPSEKTVTFLYGNVSKETD